MAAYIVLNIEVTDPAGYADYVKVAAASLEPYGGRYLARGGAAAALEGATVPKRVVILEFPSYERATAWWASSEYREPKAIRQRTATSDTIVVDGVP
jgi:uncharacterized protein (DUF1330 family)